LFSVVLEGREGGIADAGAARLLLLPLVARPLPFALLLVGKLAAAPLLFAPKWLKKDLRLSFLLAFECKEEEDVEGPTGAALVTVLGSGSAG
jgi:hypothetical protein